MKRWKHIHHKMAKGHRYTYFDTGIKNDAGRKILKRIVDERDPSFHRAYAVACDARERRLEMPGEGATFDGLIRLFEKSPEFRALADNSKDSYRHSLAKASRLLRDGDGNSVPVDQIDETDVVRIRDTLADGQGANQVVRSIGALFAWAISPGRKHAAMNPAQKVKLLPQGEHQPWPDHLVEEALQDPLVKAEVALLYFTGQRIGDVVKMQWTDIKGGMLKVKQQKTKTALLIAMLPELLGILEDVPQRSFAVLTNEKGKPWTVGGLRQRIQKWAKAKGYSVVPHGLRKNAVNALLEAGCSSAEVSSITGQDLKTIEHYAKLRDRSKISTAAVLRLETARNTKRT